MAIPSLLEKKTSCKVLESSRMMPGSSEKPCVTLTAGSNKTGWELTMAVKMMNKTAVCIVVELCNVAGMTTIECVLA